MKKSAGPSALSHVVPNFPIVEVNMMKNLKECNLIIAVILYKFQNSDKS